MIFANTSVKLRKLGLPRNWQIYIVLHMMFSLSLIFMTNEFLLNISNIILTVTISFGVIAGLKHHKHSLQPWGLLSGGILLISLSVIMHSLLYFGLKTNPILISSIEEIGIILVSLFTFSFLLRFESEYNQHGFTVNYSLLTVSVILFLLIIVPSSVHTFLKDLSITQQFNILNLFFSMLFLSMTVLNQILCKTLFLKDVVRVLMVLFLGTHFGIELINGLNMVEGNNLYSRISWSFYQLTGSLTIAFVFLEKLTTDYHKRSATYLSNQFMWSASITAIVAIPLGIIIRDRMGSPPISTLIIGIASFLLSSIVIWRFQKLIKSINQQRKDLKAIAYTDPLTGLYNYHGYLDKLSRKVVDNLFVISLNVEDFKSINDLYGRAYGDDVLKSLAKRLSETPGAILVARTGSDYFQAVFRTSVKNIPNLIDNIRDHLGVWDTVNNRRVAVPLTFGASYGSHPDKPEVLARQAEQALKVSRNTHTDFTLYSTNKQNSHNNIELPRHELREILQKAVDDNFLPIHFQPIYDLKTGTLKALELLIRVESEEHGLLLPGQFLEQAQAYGLLTSLTQVCVNTVAKCYDQLPSVTININVPPYMLNSPIALKEFIACFQRSNLPMQHFCIEITEDGDIPTDHLVPAIKLLKSHGFKIAMDDFGTGYSSLSRLSALPVDVVKIDRSLLLAASAGNKSILESAITLTKRLGASTVVEGVETLEQLSLIRQLGADSVQGFLLSRPVKISKATHLSLNAADIIPEF